MPWARPKPCTASGCPNMQPCPTHKRVAPRSWGHDKRPNAAARGYARADWQSVRKSVLKRDRFECACGARAVLVHHIKPITGADDPERLNPENCVSMCRACHERVHGRSR